MYSPLKLTVVASLLLVLLINPVAAQAKNADDKVKKTGSLAEQLKRNKKLHLTLEKVLEYLLRQNLDVRQALLEYRGADTDLRKHKAMYDYNLFGKGAYSYSESAKDDPATKFQGEETIKKSYGVGISKYFNTGTSVRLSLEGYHQNIKGATIDFGPQTINLGGEGYQSSFMLSISQEILKNSFGVKDKLTEQKLANRAEINRRLVKQYLSSLFVDALVGYWNVAVAEESLKTSKIQMDGTVRIRNLIARKLNLGLSEREELMEWNSRLLQSKNQHELAQKTLFDARLAVLRTLNLSEKTKFDIGPAFKTTPPEVAYEEAIKDAFSKRIDLKNQKTELRNSELELKIASHNLLPSVKLNLGAGSLDYSQDTYAQTFNDINKQYSVGVELNYPLGNTEADVKMRDARLKYQKQIVTLKKLEKEIRDEIDSRINECSTNYTVFIQTKKAREYQVNYYNQVLRKFGQGRYSALTVKLALDDYINLRLKELQSLLNYNASLLKRDLSRNVIFEQLEIDIDRILKRVK